MNFGTSFLKSKIARRFCLLFILCAFLPTVILIALSYSKVMNQLEEQNSIRLKRDLRAYGSSLFDRTLRIDNELQAIGSAFNAGEVEGKRRLEKSPDDLARLFTGIALRYGEKNYSTVFGALDTPAVDLFLTQEILADAKPFIITIAKEHGADIYFGSNLGGQKGQPVTVLALVEKAYLWGIGPEPILPPMTELSVFDRNGESIMASEDGVSISYQELSRRRISSKKDLHFFQFEQEGEIYLASVINLFIESRFQRTGWTIMLSQKRSDIMASSKNFKSTVALILLLLLLTILYLSVLFIRKGLEPLEQLKEATKRIANKEFSTTTNIQSDDEFQELGDAFNSMAVKLDKQFTTLLVLGEIDRAILSSLERTMVVASTLQRLKDFFACDFCLFVRKSVASSQHIKVYTLQGRRLGDPQVEHFNLAEDESKRLFADYSHQLLGDRASSLGFLPKLDEGFAGECLCLPIAVLGTIDRLLILGWKQPHVFHDDEIHQARKIANQLAIAIANSLHLENLEKLATGTIEALARTVDAKSKWTAGHSERVAALGAKIGKILRLSDTLIETITRGGLLHDIGKIGIPLAILDKPDCLTDEEYKEIKHHPAIGGQILEPITAFQDILPVVVQHHEKYDGTGYPEGLKGDDIDIRARILAIADVWDALVSTRPYRQGWIKDRAIKFIVEASGTHFDPQVVNAFVSAVAEENEDLA